MNSFEKLSEDDQQALLKFPVYIALLAANADEEFDEQEDDAATDLDYVKTYFCNPVMADFYYHAGQVFEQNLLRIDDELPKGKLQRDVAIKIELRKMEQLLSKFDQISAATMCQSMKMFKEHVSKAHYNLLEDFMFPDHISSDLLYRA
jgi:hypothetical protein